MLPGLESVQSRLILHTRLLTPDELQFSRTIILVHACVGHIGCSAATTLRRPFWFSRSSVLTSGYNHFSESQSDPLSMCTFVLLLSTLRESISAVGKSSQVTHRYDVLHKWHQPYTSSYYRRNCLHTSSVAAFDASFHVGWLISTARKANHKPSLLINL